MLLPLLDARGVGPRCLFSGVAVTLAADGWEVEETSADRPYDLRCTRNGKELLVEVKGTTGLAEEIHLTAGEVAHAPSKSGVESRYSSSPGITVSGQETGEFVASGGMPRLASAWDMDTGELRAVAYDWHPRWS